MLGSDLRETARARPVVEPPTTHAAPKVRMLTVPRPGSSTIQAELNVQVDPDTAMAAVVPMVNQTHTSTSVTIHRANPTTRGTPSTVRGGW